MPDDASSANAKKNTVTAELTGKEWDVIVIGAGIGGGVVGRRLAEKGLSVLFLEKGPAGYRKESQQLPTHGDPEARLTRGAWPDPVSATVDGKTFDIFAPLGAGVGGSSVFYAAALERFAKHDIDATQDLSHPTGGWPVSYNEFLPYFEQAERMFHVCGEADPLNPDDNKALRKPPAYSQADQHMLQRLEAAGMAPYRMHVGIRYDEGCQECVGFKCPRPCKQDGRSAGVEPALETGRAALLDHCAVEKIEISGKSVSGIVARRGGEQLHFNAKQIVIAAGGYSTPGLA